MRHEKICDTRLLVFKMVEVGSGQRRKNDEERQVMNKSQRGVTWSLLRSTHSSSVTFHSQNWSENRENTFFFLTRFKTYNINVKRTKYGTNLATLYARYAIIFYISLDAITYKMWVEHWTRVRPVCALLGHCERGVEFNVRPTIECILCTCLQYICHNISVDHPTGLDCLIKTIRQIICLPRRYRLVA